MVNMLAFSMENLSVRPLKEYSVETLGFIFGFFLQILWIPLVNFTEIYSEVPLENLVSIILVLIQ